MQITLQPQLDTAIHAATKAADVLKKYFRRSNRIGFKSSYNLVSQADIESEQVIARAIKNAFPDHEVLGEENEKSNTCSENLWIVDPLDGTNNFCHGLDHFAISIAYYQNHEPSLGVVFQPEQNNWYIASKGEGAFRNDERVSVGSFASLNEALIGTGFYYDRGHQMRSTLATIESMFDVNIHGIRRMGTASLDLCMVGCGSFGGYFEFELAPWDYAAGKLFVEEAGGIVTDCNGGSFRTGNSSIIAACPGLHGSMLRLIKPKFEKSRQSS